VLRPGAFEVEGLPGSTVHSAAFAAASRSSECFRFDDNQAGSSPVDILYVQAVRQNAAVQDTCCCLSIKDHRRPDDAGAQPSL
jgi:hypothetical protein